MFEAIARQGDQITAVIANPRLARPADLIALTDRGGRLLDIAAPGRPSALSMRVSGDAPEAPDQVLFAGAPAEAALLYALFDGAWAELDGRAPIDDLAARIDWLNAPFLARTAHPACAPAEALALGATPDAVLAGMRADLFGAAAARYSFDAAAGRRQLRQSSARRGDAAAATMLWIAASEAMAEFCWRRPIAERPRLPAASWFRSRAGHQAHLTAPRAAPALAAMRTDSVEDAFRVIGARFDPSLWRRAHYADLLQSVGGQIGRFAKIAAPLPLIWV